jgi:TetR/AcrR family transcriptional regulator|tara:strand:+ start:169055 stop:169693 length:639 start_codon:yes stop_codon:yes gene_type:complete
MGVADAERPPARQERGEATRRSILAAAETLFAEVGFASARLEDVALAVGIRRPSIVYYFPSKQVLYDEVEASIFSALHEATIDRVAPADDPLAQLLALFDCWLDFMVDRPTAARIIQRNVADIAPRAQDPVEFSETTLLDIERIVKEGIAAGQFRAIPPVQLLNTVGSSILYYVCNANQFGASRRYDCADPKELSDFRDLLRALTLAAVRRS